ncbi:MAG: hypothetical protein VR65_09330 [Desulfobulbaceae bacterium BRH_c16a]|nr:MAG: hypothetical protein VR65_09330 [Desulfobulbaceae bacterium BRH_c16a]
MLKRLLPWRFLLRLAAKRFDTVDPLSVAARIRSFAQPSEVQEPIELLRAGIIFHARGLVNTKAIQHNLDWVWPYWVERQFNPKDPSFIPRAFSFSHINLTHRNWTAVGKPDLPLYPIVDPHGLVTPFHDGWSIDCWFLDDEGKTVCPSKLKGVQQKLKDDTNRRVITRCTTEVVNLRSEVAMDEDNPRPVLQLKARAKASIGGWLIFALRPYNPEGVQFIEKVELLEGQDGWLVNGTTRIILEEKPEKILFSNYKEGDIFYRLNEKQTSTGISCRIGMVTSAAFYRMEADEDARDFMLSVPLSPSKSFPHLTTSRSWPEAEIEAAELQVPDAEIQFLYETATRTLIHLSAGDVIPGPYTYNRFWFRDACIMLNAMLVVGLKDRCLRHLNTFAARQTNEGYFHSQDGEWDSNGQVLWLFNRYRLLSDGNFNPDWIKPIVKGAGWIARKRIFSEKNKKINGLLPAGFSAEHFGPNDNYYWDDFWAVAGLQGAADILAAHGLEKEERAIGNTALEMEKDLFRSIALVAEEKNTLAIPTSPNRRLDSGAIGSIVADFPLQLLPPGDKRMLATAGFLMNNCLQKGCVFQDMIHSGINIYMTLELAQVYLRAGDPRFRSLMAAAASLASPTGQWPEAIHPLTDGGCMGDGQHGWAAAEWLLLIRNIFVMDEKDSLVIGRGVLPEWIQRKKKLSYGPTLTPFGRVSVEIDCRYTSPEVHLKADWYKRRPEKITVHLPGFKPGSLSEPNYLCRVEVEE